MASYKETQTEDMPDATVTPNFYQYFLSLNSAWFSLDGKRMPHEIIEIYKNPHPLLDPAIKNLDDIM